MRPGCSNQSDGNRELNYQVDGPWCDAKSMSINLPLRFTLLLRAKSDQLPGINSLGNTILALCQGCQGLSVALGEHVDTHAVEE